MGILSLLTFFPLIGVVALLIMRKASDNALKWVAISTAIATFALSLVVLGQFEAGEASLQLVERFSWIEPWGIEYHMG
ncbi:MAG: hypothetical protein KC433_18560, partial [Anaerolineales bacterium]|nr:hypothetical protein [Anaerolineales bacterium]